MWSKQQTETRDNNKNMTSFRNKITNRKRKNVDSAAEPDLAAEPKQNEDKKRQPKGGKNRGRNRGKKDTVNTTNGKSNNNVSVEQNSKNVESEKTNEDDDVVLRNPPSSDRNTNTTTKRYSDSFVIDNDGGQMKLKEHNCVGPGLTRAVSGFFILDHARKAANRRLSDLFRPSSTMKLSSSVENLNTTMDKKTVNLKELSQNKTSKKTLKEKNTNNVNTNKNKQNKKSDNTTQTMSKTTVKKQPSMNEHNSYLKRVKSKIYNKTKSENNSDEVDGDIKNRKNKPKKGMEINGRIPEETEATLTPNGLRKSLTHFDFRLTRQTSNLERIRPSALSSTKEESSSDGKKPLLEKAKSSSSINLNLLRTRRNKLLEQMASRLGAKDVQNEFDFIAFGSVNNVAKLAQSDGVFGSQTSLHKQPSWLHIHKENEVESKQSQPVSRSGSDRRPDAVREEGLKHQDSATHGESTVHGEASHERLESTSPDSSTILPASGNTRRTNSNINRSESVKEQSEKRKQRRNISDPSHNTTSGDVELERHTAFSNTESGSSSNSSISCNGRLSESPSNSTDVVGQPVVRTNLDSDSDMEADTEPWQNLVPLEELKNLSPHEKKRQDVINELFHTEGSHVRNLKVLYKIFYKKIHDSQMLKPDELSLIFPNIKEMLDIHTEINKEMRRQRKEDPLVKEIGEMMLKIFDEKQGEALKKAAATFCERQQLALEFIKKRRERDSKFDALLTECEKKRQCRRLPFQGILPTEMQRLSKYPLLLERLISSIESNKDKDNEQVHQEELSRLRRAHHMSKEILNYVNEAAKVAHNRHRLEEIQKHLDTSNFERSEQPIALEFKTLDLTKYRLILEGGMQLRRPNKAVVPVHILLLEEAVVILHRESDKFLLKFFQSQPSPLSPIIKMNTLLVRYNAVCKNALFLVNMSTNNSQMYDLIAEDESKRNVWFKHFSDAAETYNRREGKTKRSRDAADDESDSESVQDLPAAHEVAAVQAEAVGGDDSGPSTSTDAQATTTEGTITEDSERVKDEESASVSDVERDSTASPDMVAGGGVQTSKVSAEDWPLIQPSQVNIAVPPVHTAESMLTPLEQIRRKDALVNQALEDKESLVADMLSIPREHFQHIADMATVDNSASREPSERVLASIFQVDQLQKAVNSALNVSEMDAITAKGGKHPTCASQDAQNDVTFNLPVGLVRDIATSLSTQLTTLLSEVKQMEEERDRLRRELHKVRERLHQEHNLHSPVSLEQVETETSTDCASETTTSLNDNNQVISKSDCEEEEQ